MLDPCTVKTNPTFAKEIFYPPHDGLTKFWGTGLVFCNPPYSQSKKWLKKCSYEGGRGTEIICLVPSRTDTKAWHAYVPTCDAVCFLQGRVVFNDPNTGQSKGAGAPFPSVLLYWGPQPGKFAEVFCDHGMVL
jgi:hypothetical protein